MVEEGEFRSDLLYRINGVTIALPPLRERVEDIRPMLEYFLSRARIELEKPDVEGISPDALEILEAYSWPGTVRDLQSVVRRAVLNAAGPVIVPAFLPDEVTASEPVPLPVRRVPTSESDGAGLPVSDLAPFVEQQLKSGSSELYNQTLEVMERYLITRVLRATDGNQSKASRILGITRAKIRDRIAAYGISLDKQVNIDSEA
jgi:two-component system nitrogen regulation response regulator GlnG